MINTALVLPLRTNEYKEILLGCKKSGFGAGKFTGFGGKIEPNETIPGAARREFFEETGISLDITCFDPVAVLGFHFPHKPEWDQSVHVFTTRIRDQVPRESEEMFPKWFSITKIPYSQMWDDARYWLPRILKGELFKADFYFHKDNSTVEKSIFKPINNSLSSSFP